MESLLYWALMLPYKRDRIVEERRKILDLRLSMAVQGPFEEKYWDTSIHPILEKYDKIREFNNEREIAEDQDLKEQAKELHSLVESI